LAYDYEVAPSWHHSWIPSHRFGFGGAKLTFRLSSLRGSFGGFFFAGRDDSKEEQEGATDAVKDEHGFIDYIYCVCIFTYHDWIEITMDLCCR